ncbi:MAG: putative phage associated protein [Verrucomicrobiales bacterium]|nr:putative phage associated protein [Verrucomicrobiales bacterium]
MSMVLQSKVSTEFKPHPEGIHPAVCVDVIDLGLVENEFQGEKRMVHKLRLVFESEQKLDDGRNCTITKNFTASLHPKAKLAEFLGKWRGRPVVPGETIDLGKLIGASCTLVISHQLNLSGQTYGAIDAVSKPTKKLAPSGHYDPAAARQRIADAKAKAGQGIPSNVPAARANVPAPAMPARSITPAAPVAESKSAAPTPAPSVPEYDPEVGF